jgi:signal transduction histidine kinase/ligand-binding sensor domain-containing protein
MIGNCLGINRGSFLFLLLLFAAHSGLHAQIPKQSFKHLSIDDGLSQSQVHDIIQGPFGFIWIATSDGLNKYDGNQFTVYRKLPYDSNSISENKILCLAITRDTDLCVGTYSSGVNIINLKTGAIQKFNHENSPLSDNNIKDLKEDHKGNLWIGTGNGLNMYNPVTHKWKLYKKIGKEGIDKRTNIIQAIFEDREHRIWVAIEYDGVYMINDHDELERIPFAGNYDIKNVSNLDCDAQNNIWVATGNGIYKIPSGSRKMEWFDMHFRKDKKVQVHCMMIDDEQNMWLVLKGQGLKRFNLLTNKMLSYSTEVSSSNREDYIVINAMMYDRSGVMWLGMNGTGVKYFNVYSSFNHLSLDLGSRYSISSRSIRAIVEDPYEKNILWIGGYGGLDKFDKETGLVENFNQIKNGNLGFDHDPVYCMYRDSKDLLIMGVEGGGVFFFDTKRKQFKRYKYAADDHTTPSGNFVFKILKDYNGVIWFATNNGICSYDRKQDRFHRYLFDATMASRFIVSDMVEVNGKLLLATEGGIVEFDIRTGAYRQLYLGIKAIKDPHVLTFYYKKDSSYLWIGTYGYGMAKIKIDFSGQYWKYTKTETYNITNGLPNDVIYGIEADKAGNLWISTNNGLSRFNMISHSFHNYTYSDGLQSNEFNKAAHFTDSKGVIYFGGINGITYFNPLKIRRNKIKPNVAFTSFKIFNSPLSLAYDINQLSEISVRYDQNVISFDFSANDYVAKEKNQYAYILRGFDDHIVFLGNKSSVTFTNLNPGDYELKIMASNNDGYWNFEGRTMKLHVVPPIWLTWWFQGLIVVLAVVFITLAVRMRIKFIRGRTNVLEQEVQKRTAELLLKNEELEHAKNRAEQSDKAKSDFLAMMSHEIRTPMNGVIGMISLLEETRLDSDQQRFIDTIKISSDNLLNVINDILDFSKIASGRIELIEKRFNVIDFIENTTQLYYSNAIDKGIELVSYISDNVPSYVIADNLRLNQVIYNLLNNAIKFTQSGFIHMNIDSKVRNGSFVLEFTIEDSGIGIPANQQQHIFDMFTQADGSISRKYGGTGLGLSICKLLVERMGGQISLKSEYNIGSSFTFFIPVVKDADPVNVHQDYYCDKKLLVIHPCNKLGKVLISYGEKLGVETRQIHKVNQMYVDVEYTPDLIMIDETMAQQEQEELKKMMKEMSSQPVLVKLRSSSDVRGDFKTEPFLFKPIKRIDFAMLFKKLFDINMPIVAVEQPVVQKQPADKSIVAKECPITILVAEDNEVNKMIVKRILNLLGYQPHMVSNGKQAVEELRRTPYDLILMDIQMPEMDGITATEILLREHILPSYSRIVALTASVMDDEKNNCPIISAI